eukprot:COSAG02_NODE_16065_length_1116_cov_0.939036_1_plen_88_part_00
MPDICFHFSSERAHANGLTAGDDKTRISMPLEPAIQIPNTAKPTCYLHNMAFTNSIANVCNGLREVRVYKEPVFSDDAPDTDAQNEP